MALLVPPASFASQLMATGALVTADGTAHTKGAYSQLVAATTFDTYEVDILVYGVAVAGTVTSTLVDIAVGGAGSEVVVVPNLLAGGATTDALASVRYRFPLFIPAGSRIAARSQAAISSDTVGVRMLLKTGPSMPVWAGRVVTAYNVDTATSTTSSTVASGASSSEGTWTQVVASTSMNHWYVAMGIDGGTDTTWQGNTLLSDIGVGAAASESAFVTDCIAYGSGSEAMSVVVPHGGYHAIPAGSRLAVRMLGDGTAQAWGVALYGVS